MSRRWIVIGSVLMVLVAAVAVGALHHFYGGGTDQDSAGLDMVRTAGTLVVGVGGLFALLLAARRQRSTEQTLVHQYLTLEHQREVAATAARDAVEQRITELYTRAVDQLGNGQAPVRLGGLYALERLAQNSPTQRQTIIDVICAYLRMPFMPPEDQAPSEDASEHTHSRYEQCRQELQVRLTAQHILTTHLNPDAAAAFWDDIDLNLTEAHLHHLDLRACHIQRARFRGVRFAGDTLFGRTKFAEDAKFDGATFSGYAEFKGATFSGNAEFNGATFSGYAEFERATFAGDAEFNRATFPGDVAFEGAAFAGYVGFHQATFAEGVGFEGATFAGDVGFVEATFSKGAMFRGVTFPKDTDFLDAKFAEYASFSQATFAGYTGFDGTEFAGGAEFGGVTFAGDTHFDGARLAPSFRRIVFPRGWITRAAQPAKGEEEGWLYVVRDQDSSKQPTEATDDEED